MNHHNLAKAYEEYYFKRKKVLTKRRRKKEFHLYKESLLKRFPKLYNHNKEIFDDIQDLQKKWKKGLDAFKYPARKQKRNARLEELWKDCTSTSCGGSSSDDDLGNPVIKTPPQPAGLLNNNSNESSLLFDLGSEEEVQEEDLNIPETKTPPQPEEEVDNMCNNSSSHFVAGIQQSNTNTYSTQE